MWQCIKCETKNKGEKCIICHEPKPALREPVVEKTPTSMPLPPRAPVPPKTTMPSGAPVPPKAVLPSGTPMPTDPSGSYGAPVSHGAGRPAMPPGASHGSMSSSGTSVSSRTPSPGFIKTTKNLVPIFGALAVVLLVICGVVLFLLLRDPQTSEVVRTGEEQATNGEEIEEVYEEEELDLVEVPDLEGLTEEEAIAAIERAGLVVGDITRSYSDDWAQGEVFESSEEAGQEIEAGTAIDLVVSLGMEILYVSPFDTGVWGRNNVKPITRDGVSLDVPIPSMISANDVIQSDEWSFFIDEEREGGYILVNILFYTDRGSESFREQAEEVINDVVEFINSNEDHSDAHVDGIYEIDGSVMAFIFFDSEEWGESIEVVKIDEYHGRILITRLRLHGDTRVRTIDFVRAYGFNDFVEAGYLVVN